MKTTLWKPATSGFVFVCLCAAAVQAQAVRPTLQLPPDRGANYSYTRGTTLASSEAQPGDIAPKPTMVDSAPSTRPMVTDQSVPGCASCNGASEVVGGDCGCGECDSCRHKCQPLIHIDECCPLECEELKTCHLFDNCCWLNQRGTTVTGWADLGIMWNGRDTDDRFNGPLTYPDRNGEGQFNQLYLAIERTAPADNCGCFIGGRLDYYFGSDFFFTTAAGLDGTNEGNVPRWNSTDSFLYGSSMPQLYVETSFDDLKVKWGHLYTPIGYEVATAKDNFFYSHSYAMQYAEPVTHTGVVATKPANENVTWLAGIVAGWNTFDADDRAAFLGGLTYADKDWGSLAFMLISGDDSVVNLPGVGPFSNRTMYSLVWVRNFTSRWTYVLQHDLGVQSDARTASGDDHAEWYGLNQYLFYKINCCWTAGLRYEIFRDDDGFVVTGLRPGNAIAGASFPGTFQEVSIGLNYKPNGNWNIRPEIRWDRYDGDPNQNGGVPVSQPFNAGNSDNQFTLGIDFVAQF